ncbi:MAG TPA: LamG domain-containing protein [Roseateles sp.]
MRSIRPLLLSLLLLGLVLASGLARAASSYTFRSDSFSWESAANAISWDRTCTSYPGDDDKATINLTGGLKFRFAGVDYTSVRVLANGGLQFGTDNGFFRTYGNTALPAGTPGSQSGCTATATNNVILAYWTDLNPSQPGSGGVTWEQKGTAPNRYLVVSWNGVYQYNTSTPYTFQILLFESASGVNGEFKFQYGNANASGSNATIGVQVSSSDYTQYSYNSGYNANGSAIRWFVPSGTPTRRAEYRFDEWSYSGRIGEVADSSGNSNNGVRVGNATTSATAKVCRSLSIPANTNSSSDAVDTLLDVNSGIGDQGSVTFWYSGNTAWNNSAAMLLDATTSTSKPFFLVRQSDGSLRFTVADGGNTLLSAVTPAQTVTANTWRHIAVTWKLATGTGQSVVRIYINGSQVGAQTGTTSGSLDNSIGTLFVGDNRSSSAPANATLNSANGLIDEMRVYNYEISALELTADMAAITRTCLPPLDHYELSVPANSLTCAPTTVTVKACSSNASTCSVEPSVNGTAVLTTSSGSLSPAVVTFSNGVATTTLSNPGGADNSNVTVTLGGESTTASNPRRCCLNGTSCAVADACVTTFNQAGFLIASSTGGGSAVITAQTAGTPSSDFYYLRAVKKGASTQACEAAVTGNRTIKWAYQCNDPATCSASDLMSLTNATPGTPPTPGATTTIKRNNGTASSLQYADVPMTFDANGNAPFKLTFSDVGLATLAATFTTTASANSTGGDVLVLAGNPTFVTKPAGFSVTQITTPTGGANQGTQATPPIFVRAGTPFSARITALTSGGATTPNFGRESAPEGVLLTPTLVAPTGGSTGVLDNATVAGTAFTNGVANVTNLGYREVGLMTLKGTVADADYLGAGDVTASAASETIGRFIPAGFTAAGTGLTHRSAMACAPASAFTYLDENVGLRFNLTAVNAQGGVTRNYAGATYARMNLGAVNFNLAGTDTTGVVTTRFAAARINVAAVAGAWPQVADPNAGVADITLTAAVLRGAAPDGPFNNTKLGIAPVDADGVGMAAFDLDTDAAVAGNDRASIVVGQIPLLYGRLRLQNALSAANRALKLPLTAQSWNGAAFVTNTLDSCTRVTAANLSFGNFRKTLAAADAVMTPNAVVVNPLQPTYITLAAPGGGRLGSMDVAVALAAGANPADASCMPAGWRTTTATNGAGLAALRGAWCGGSSDPSARATWGLYRGSDGVVYQRENY